MNTRLHYHSRVLATIMLSGLALIVLAIDIDCCLAHQKKKQPVTLTGILPAKRVPVNLDWWVRIRQNGKVHGFRHTKQIFFSKNQKVLITTTRESERDRLVLRRKAKELTTLRCVENESGVLQSFRFKQSLDNSDQHEVVGTRAGETLELIWSVNKIETREIVRCPRDTRSEFFPFRDIRQRPLEKNETRRYKIFRTESRQVVTQRWQADRQRIVRLPDGSRRKLLKVRVSDTGRPALTRYLYLDGWGHVVFSKLVQPDQTVTTTLRMNEKQVEKIVLASIQKRLKPVTFLESFKREEKRKEVVYRLTYFGNSFPIKLPVSKTQRILKKDEKFRDVEIGLARLPDFQQVQTLIPRIPIPSRLLDYRERTVLDRARRAVPLETDPASTAFRMEKYVFRNMKLKPFSPQFQAASEVAKTMQGDSTEYATLLAAMLQAKRIPSRIAFGLRHSPRNNAFVVHFWTEAWLRGTWFPLDATRGKGGITLDTIKLGDTVLRNSLKLTDLYHPFLELLPQLQIQVVEKNENQR